MAISGLPMTQRQGTRSADYAGGVVTLFSIPHGTNVLPDGITTGPDSNLWFTAQSSVVGVVTTSGTFLAQYPVPVTCSQDKGAAGIALGAD